MSEVKLPKGWQDELDALPLPEFDEYGFTNHPFPGMGLVVSMTPTRGMFAFPGHPGITAVHPGHINSHPPTRLRVKAGESAPAWSFDMRWEKSYPNSRNGYRLSTSSAVVIPDVETLPEVLTALRVASYTTWDRCPQSATDIVQNLAYQLLSKRVFPRMEELARQHDWHPDGKPDHVGLVRFQHFKRAEATFLIEQRRFMTAQAVYARAVNEMMP